MVCGYRIPEEWNSSNITDSFDRLAVGFPSEAPESFERLRRQCIAREQDGRAHFGYRYHSRDNIKDCREELADAMNYLALDRILSLRKNNDPDRADRELNAMTKVYEAYNALIELGLE